MNPLREISEFVKAPERYIFNRSRVPRELGGQGLKATGVEHHAGPETVPHIPIVRTVEEVEVALV